jgi:UDP-N-acetyl-D-galactosamine dehydrogenase
MGLSFKENCPDIRNTKIVDMVKALKEYDLDLDIYDPWVDDTEVQHEYGLAPIKELHQGQYDAIVLAVAHDQFKSMTIDQFKQLGKEKHVLYDLKYVLDKVHSDIRL